MHICGNGCSAYLSTECQHTLARIFQNDSERLSLHAGAAGHVDVCTQTGMYVCAGEAIGRTVESQRKAAHTLQSQIDGGLRTCQPHACPRRAFAYRQRHRTCTSGTHTHKCASSCTCTYTCTCTCACASGERHLMRRRLMRRRLTFQREPVTTTPRPRAERSNCACNANAAP